MTDAVSPNLERAKQILAQSPAIDFHTHLGLWETKGLGIQDPIGKYIGDDALTHHVEAMLGAGCHAASLNLTSDIPILKFGAVGNRSRDFEPGEAWAEYQRLMGVLNDVLTFLPAGIAYQLSDLDPLGEEKKLALLLSVEGAHMIEEDLSRLEIMKQDGITKLQPMHYARTTIGDNQTDQQEYGGLSDFGFEAVRHAADMGMLIDAAHATFNATADMAEATGGPIVLSHALMAYGSSFTPSDAPPNPRWISNEHAKLIADTGGLIGTWAINAPFGAGSAEEFVEAVLAMIDEVGIEHVCWATDLIQAGMGNWFKDYADFPDLCARFLDAGMSSEDLDKFLWGNVFRIYEVASI